VGLRWYRSDECRHRPISENLNVIWPLGSSPAGPRRGSGVAMIWCADADMDPGPRRAVGYHGPDRGDRGVSRPFG
jgi:hypothetical protein